MLWVFDINETMLDLTPLDALFAPGGREQWFAELIHAALVSAATGRYRSFAELGAAAFRELTPDADDAAVRQLGSVMRTLPAHADVPVGLAALRAAGHRLVALGNSPLAVVDAQLSGAGLAPLLDAFYSAEQAGALKPSRTPYEFVLRQEEYEPGDAVMVAAHGWDIAGAQAVGMRTVFVSRPGRRVLSSWPDPDAVVPDFSGLPPGGGALR
ncbi:HAD family hydrolase [Cryptosporangium arvum]|uniref:HAD family hydrolase n=1 Tax=Cryptosporangium arvum TaxID=80871 RepID=UPI0004B9F0FC|nr:HAD family hydrolase [Cryptosporangium arvum]